MLNESYLAQGLTAMSRVEGAAWPMAHFGAAVIAAFYLSRDPRFEAPVIAAIERQTDLMIARHAEAFRPEPLENPDSSLLPQVVEALDVHIDRLSHIGHNVIYATLAIKALQDCPSLMTPRIAGNIKRLIFSFTGAPLNNTDMLGIDAGSIRLDPGDDIPEYTTPGIIAESALREFLKFRIIYRQGALTHAGGIPGDGTRNPLIEPGAHRLSGKWRGGAMRHTDCRSRSLGISMHSPTRSCRQWRLRRSIRGRCRIGSRT